MQSIGYKETETIQKSEIALIQLEDAVDLFVAGSFISALTLAGAADGVLSGLLNAKGQKCTSDISVDLLKDFREMLDLDPEIDAKPKNSFFNEWNKDRNRVKHHGKNEIDAVQINSCDAAFWMLRRAFSNARLLELEIRNRSVFDNWVIQHVNL